jgi:hypothetical protein
MQQNYVALEYVLPVTEIYWSLDEVIMKQNME